MMNECRMVLFFAATCVSLMASAGDDAIGNVGETKLKGLPSGVEWRISLRPTNEGMAVSYTVKLNGAYVDLRDDQANMWFPCKGASRFWNTVQFSGEGMVAQVGATCRNGLVLICR